MTNQAGQQFVAPELQIGITPLQLSQISMSGRSFSRRSCHRYKRVGDRPSPTVDAAIEFDGKTIFVQSLNAALDILLPTN